MLAHTHARLGYLYLRHGEAFRLVAANSNDEPPQRVQDSLRENLVEGRDEDDSETRVLGQEGADDLAYRVLVLTTRAAQRRVIVGGLILRDSQHAAPDPELLEGIASALCEADPTVAAG